MTAEDRSIIRAARDEHARGRQEAHDEIEAVYVVRRRRYLVIRLSQLARVELLHDGGLSAEQGRELDGIALEMEDLLAAAPQ